MQQPTLLLCTGCKFRASYQQGIVQLKAPSRIQSRTQLKVQLPQNKPLSGDFVSPGNQQEWITLIRRLHAHYKNRQWFNEVAADGNNAVKLFIHLVPEAKILSLGSNLGNLCHDLAVNSSQVYVLDTNLNSLKLAQGRNAVFYQHKNLTWIYHQAVQYLPFGAESLDVVLICHRFFEHINNQQDAKKSLLRQIYRVLKPSGQLLFVEHNKYDLNHLIERSGAKRLSGLACLLPAKLQRIFNVNVHRDSLAGYKKRLQDAGFSINAVNSLNDKESLLRTIQPLGNKHFVLGSQSKGLTKKLKQHALMQSSFALSAVKGEMSGPMIIEQIVEAIKTRLNCQYSDPVLLSSIDITGKNKGIIKLQCNNLYYIVKLPFDASGLQGEINNKLCLERMARQGLLKLIRPQCLTSGEISGCAYFVESFCSGAPLQQAIKQYGREYFAEQIFNVWYQLATYVDHNKVSLMALDYFAQLVEQPANKVRLLSPLHTELDNIVAYLRDNLLTSPMPLGLFHGDFSVSNTLTKDGQITTLIDWETCHFNAACLIDLISIYTSIERMFKPDSDIVDNLMALLSDSWSNTVEASFIAKAYQILDLSLGQRRALIIASWFHGMSQQLETDLIYQDKIINKRINRYLHTINKYLMT
jgi:SAM-dependent methyltransferase/thiamine kinase-like enzyme